MTIDELKEPFDINLQENIGRPYYFDLSKFIETVEMFIKSDEIQIAMWMLDNPPAWYRENPPKELTEIKNKIYKNSYDVFLYGNDDDEAGCTREFGENQWLGQYCFPRNQIINEIISRLNQDKKTPWIFDLSCSHGNLPLGLAKLGFEFNYLGKSMNHRAAMKIKDWIGEHWQDTPKPGQTTILVCTEALEHAWNPHDIVHASYKVGVEFDQIVLSTPLGCLFGGLPSYDRPLGHVRGWTGQEFIEFANKAFPNFAWKHYRSHSQVLHGVRNA